MSRTALVTGANGYIALHVVKLLLEGGWAIHATVRSLQNEKKLKPLLELERAYSGRLKFFEADLLDASSFFEPMQGCDVVFHVASPCLMPERVKDAQKDLVTPALEGTRNVFESVNQTPSVERVVLTSSESAVRGNADQTLLMENHTVREEYWNNSSSLNNYPYAYSKMLAEREAWRIADAQNRWKLVTICPGTVVGPSLSPGSISASIDLIGQIINGQMIFGVPNMSLVMVDVREVALAHVRAATVPAASGRYLLSKEVKSILEIALILRSVHNYPWIVPFWKMPDFILRIFGPFVGVSREYIDANLGFSFSVDNSKSIADLGIQYRSVEESLADHYQDVLRAAKK